MPITSDTDTLASVGDFEDMFSFGTLAGADLARATVALQVATSSVRAGRRYFTLVTDDEVTVDGPGGCELLLPKDKLPVVDVTEVTNLARGDTTPVTLADTDIDWDPSGIITLHRGSSIGSWWTRRERGITITYSHGYADIPAAVQWVCLSVAKRVYDNPAAANVRSESLGDYSVTYDSSAGGLLPHEEDILKNYELVL